jgi:hypothetical protein
MISVVLDAPDTSASAIALLDKGFATPPGATGTGDVLPAVNLPANALAPAAAIAAARAAAAPAPAVHHASPSGVNWTEVAIGVVLLGVPFILAITARRREVRRRRQRRLAARRLAATSGHSSSGIGPSGAYGPSGRVVPIRRSQLAPGDAARERRAAQR